MSSVVHTEAYTTFQSLHAGLEPADCLVPTFPTVLLTPSKTVNISMQN